MNHQRVALYRFSLLQFLILLFAFLAALFILMPSAQAKPADGYALHIDAKKHFPGNPETIAHHYCKPVSDGLVECQLYDSDNNDAKLVGAEMVIGPELYNSFSNREKRKWHYHKEEIPLVDATLPDLSPEAAEKVAKSLEETYGKIYLFWDPTEQNLPVGDPFVHDIHSTDEAESDTCW